MPRPLVRRARSFISWPTTRRLDGWPTSEIWVPHLRDSGIFPISGIPKKISSRSGVFFDAQKPALNHHVFAPNHHTKTTISPSQNNHFFPHPLQKNQQKTQKSPPSHH